MNCLMRAVELRFKALHDCKIRVRVFGAKI